MWKALLCVCEQLIRLPFFTHIIIAFCANSSANVNHKILSVGKFHCNFMAVKSLKSSAGSFITNLFTSWLKINLTLDYARPWNPGTYVLAVWLVFENYKLVVVSGQTPAALPECHGKLSCHEVTQPQHGASKTQREGREVNLHLASHPTVICTHILTGKQNIEISFL